jgi:hypothetical protein
LANIAAIHAAKVADVLVVEFLKVRARWNEADDDETDIEPPIDDEKSWELYRKRAAFTNPAYTGVTLFTYLPILPSILNRVFSSVKCITLLYRIKIAGIPSIERQRLA